MDTTTPSPAHPPLQRLAIEVGERLAAVDWLLVSAESCTGGMIAAAITDVPGSSAWFERGYVTYSNEAKSTAIGVPGPLIARHGAVSEPVAQAMAEGALAASLAQIAVAVTGIAGPGGGTPGKPVGTVCFGWTCWKRRRADVGTGASAAGGAVASADTPDTMVETRHFPGDRASVRAQASEHALRGVLRLLENVPAPGG